VKLFLIRHGRTPANNEKKLIGQKYNCDVSEFGIEQIKKLACELNNTYFDVLISSPLLRAKHTAKILSDAFTGNVQIIIDTAITERDYGEFEFLDKETLKLKKESMGIKFGDIVNYFPNHIGGVELRKNVFRRIQNSLNLAKTQYGENATLAYVTHAGVIYSFITESLGIPEERDKPFKIREASYLECNVDAHNIVEIMGLWNNPLQ
jgi:probable phosphoglycerate mutase